MLATGVLFVVVSTAMRLTALAIVAHAALALRAAAGHVLSGRQIAAAALRAVLPGRTWNARMEPRLVKHLELFGRRRWIALALLVAESLLGVGVRTLVSG